MRTAVPFVAGLFLLVLVACSSVAPVAIRRGDICEETRQPIQNVKIAAEIVPPGGRLALKFRTVTSMARYLQEHGDTPGTIFVTNYSTGRLIPVETAVFVKGQIDDNTNELGYYAFDSVKAAVAFSGKSGEPTTDWPSIRETVAAGKH